MKLFSYKSKGDYLHKLENNVLFIGDTFTQDDLTENTRYSQPKYIVNDHWSYTEFKDQIIYSAPVWLANMVEKLKPDSLPQVSDKYTFNFMVNKKQINRYLCIKLVEMFELSDYAYTWSGIGRSFDMQQIIKELTELGSNSPLSDQQRSFLLAPIGIPERFLEKPVETDGHQDIWVLYQGNVWTWQNIFKEFFSACAISLITESVRDEKAAVFTEKTAFATLGLNFPIWVGGYNQAHEWKKLGFDIFDDVIDHSYQNKSTLVERCYYAVADNLEILQNKELAHKLRKKHFDRLLNNRNLMLNFQLIKSCKRIFASWPSDLQQIMPELYKQHFKITHFSDT